MIIIISNCSQKFSRGIKRERGTKVSENANPAFYTSKYSLFTAFGNFYRFFCALNILICSCTTSMSDIICVSGFEVLAALKPPGRRKLGQLALDIDFGLLFNLCRSIEFLFGSIKAFLLSFDNKLLMRVCFAELDD